MHSASRHSSCLIHAICSVYLQMSLAKALYCRIKQSLSEISTAAMVLPSIVAVNTKVSALRKYWDIPYVIIRRRNSFIRFVIAIIAVYCMNCSYNRKN